MTLNEHPDSNNDAFFIVGVNVTQWGDLPASFHNRACGFSFADGHAEIHKWQSATSVYPVRYNFATVPFDAAGYRARREAALDSLAVRSAERAVSTGRAVELDPMTAVERKVVHVHLKEFAGVSTRSEGTEPNRFVVIEPE